MGHVLCYVNPSGAVFVGGAAKIMNGSVAVIESSATVEGGPRFARHRGKIDLKYLIVLARSAVTPTHKTVVVHAWAGGKVDRQLQTCGVQRFDSHCSDWCPDTSNTI